MAIIPDTASLAMAESMKELSSSGMVSCRPVEPSINRARNTTRERSGPR
jgi:hypothetical protein